MMPIRVWDPTLSAPYLAIPQKFCFPYVAALPGWHLELLTPVHALGQVLAKGKN